MTITVTRLKQAAEALRDKFMAQRSFDMTNAFVMTKLAESPTLLTMLAEKLSERAAPASPPVELATMVHTLRHREIQAIGAAISRRSWHDVETAYNQARDRIDRFNVENKS